MPIFSASPLVYTSPSTFDKVAQVSGSLTGQLGATLLGMVVENTNGSTRWIQVFDGYSNVTTGAVPLLSIKMLTATQQVLNLMSTLPLHFVNGICIATSTTGPTYTAGSSDMFLTAWWQLK
jgi:hypothetical protein